MLTATWRSPMATARSLCRVCRWIVTRRWSACAPGLALNRDVRVNLDYNGLIGNNEKDHGVGLTLDWQF